MTDTATLRRRLGAGEDVSDALLRDLLLDAERYVLAYTRMLVVPDALAGVVTELAAVGYNRLGTQGERSHAEGGVSVVMDGLPAPMRAVLDRFRKARVV